MKEYRLQIAGRKNSYYGYYGRSNNKDSYEKFKNNFIRVLNKVVELGGVFCYGKDQLDSDWRFYSDRVLIKLPEEKESELRMMPKDVLDSVTAV